MPCSSLAILHASMTILPTSPSFPSPVSANGLTYHYEADGCHGDCRGEKLVYLTSGGDVERPESLGVLYWKQLCAMFGIPAFDYVFAGGLDLDPAKTEEILAEACEKARWLAETF